MRGWNHWWQIAMLPHLAVKGYIYTYIYIHIPAKSISLHSVVLHPTLWRVQELIKNHFASFSACFLCGVMKSDFCVTSPNLATCYSSLSIVHTDVVPITPRNQNVICRNHYWVGSNSYSSIPKEILPPQFSLHIISAGAPLNITAERIVPSFSDTRAVFVIYRKPTLTRYLNRKLRWRKRLRIDCSNSYCENRNSK